MLPLTDLVDELGDGNIVRAAKYQPSHWTRRYAVTTLRAACTAYNIDVPATANKMKVGEAIVRWVSDG
jgi:hypothetical protein